MTPAYADVTRLLITWLSGQFPSPIVTVTDVPSDITGTTRVIQVTRTGGSRRKLLDHARVRIDCYASTDFGDSKEAGARDLCNDVLSAMEFNLPRAVVNGQSFGSVKVTSAIAVVAQANPNVRCVGAMCMVTVHSA